MYKIDFKKVEKKKKKKTVGRVRSLKKTRFDMLEALASLESTVVVLNVKRSIETGWNASRFSSNKTRNKPYPGELKPETGI
jgi:hypothetical protein